MKKTLSFIIISISIVIVSMGLHFCLPKDGMETEIGSVIPSTTSQVGGNFKNPGVVDKIEKRDGTRFVLRKLDDDAIGVINEHIPVIYFSRFSQWLWLQGGFGYIFTRASILSSQ
jgi:hypothetical protein